MKVVLIKDVKDVGKAGEVVNVSEGYGRNFLIPRKLAILGDAGALKNVADKKKNDAHKEALLLQHAKDTAAKMKDLTVTVKAKAGSENRLFGSVTGGEIAEVLEKDHDIKIDKRTINLKTPIKTPGAHEVTVKLHKDVSCKLNVNVVTE
ncbi:MAG: 50S ribosomal protein L9 [Abditibacteriota bacterium]|jgi:large subunit ribosomal protein L9|nr:50S ribosomal protein L9 [Abditibacteriota bacterium]MBP5738672.1 50S ribosomal protein L9 [Abditibacteriota bacterium]